VGLTASAELQVKHEVCIRFKFCKRRVWVQFDSGPSSVELEISVMD